MKRTLQNHILDTFSPIGKPYQKEFLVRNIYGSSRLGTLKDPLEVFSGVPLPSYGMVGNRNYELTNHLGNVLTVINDIKYPLADNGTITGYETGISHVFDYSPFGAPLDGRTIEQTLYQEVTTSTTTYTTEYALEEHFDSSPNWTPLTASSQVSYPSQVMRVKNTQTTKKTIGATESFTTGDGVHSLSFKSIVIPKDLCQAIIIKNSLATPQFNQNLYLQVIIRNQNGVVVATDSINVTGNYPDFLNFTATSGYTYSIEFVMRSVCGSNAVNNYFEEDDVLITYEEATTEEQTEFVASGAYLWGFNTQQRVDEIAGKGNHYTAEFWEYSPRLGKRWNLDPVVKPWESGYTVLSNNPIMLIDPSGADVINAYKADNEKAENNLNSAKEKFEGLNKRDKGYKTAKKELKQAKKDFNIINPKYQRVENKIKEIKEKDIGLFNDANELTDAGGTKVNIYIYDTPHDKMQIGVKEGMQKFGDTDAKPGVHVSSFDGSKPDYIAVTSKMHGDNTITIRVSDEATTIHLAHEFGHAIFQAKYMKQYIEWLKENPKEQNKNGHGKGDPSGKAAEDAEKKFK